MMQALLIVFIFVHLVGSQQHCLSTLTNSPPLPSPLNTYIPSDFNVISFQDFQASSGNIGGRLAAQNNTQLGAGFSIGYDLITGGTTPSDRQQPYSLVVGDNLNWVSGALYPDGTGVPYPGPAEGIYVGGNFTGPSYLDNGILGGPCPSPGCLNNFFSSLYAYYNYAISYWLTQTLNANYTILNGGIVLESNDTGAFAYYVQIDAAIFSNADSLSLGSLSPTAEYIFIISGGDITFQGSGFNGKFGLTAYVIAESVNINVGEAQVVGSIIAPNAVLNQTGGSINGYVAVANVVNFVSSIKPNCSIYETSGSFSVTTELQTTHFQTTQQVTQITTESVPTPTTKCLSELTSGPNLPSPLGQYIPSDFNVVSFNNFIHPSSGDVEGRVAVRNNTTFGARFSIGYALDTGGSNPPDNPRNYSLIVGNNLDWVSGALYPDGTGVPYPGPAEGIYVGGNFTGPSYLDNGILGGPCPTPGCLNPAFDWLHSFYVNLSIFWSSQPINTNYSIVNDGIVLESNVTASRYYVQIDASVISTATSFTVGSLNPNAEYIFTITGGDVTFSGSNFNANPGSTVWNIPGSRKIDIHNIQIIGNLIAPNAILNQTGGDLVGMVAVGDIVNFVEAIKPNCTTLYLTTAMQTTAIQTTQQQTTQQQTTQQQTTQQQTTQQQTTQQQTTQQKTTQQQTTAMQTTQQQTTQQQTTSSQTSGFIPSPPPICSNVPIEIVKGSECVSFHIPVNIPFNNVNGISTQNISCNLTGTVPAYTKLNIYAKSFFYASGFFCDSSLGSSTQTITGLDNCVSTFETQFNLNNCPYSVFTTDEFLTITVCDSSSNSGNFFSDVQRVYESLQFSCSELVCFPCNLFS